MDRLSARERLALVLACGALLLDGIAVSMVGIAVPSIGVAFVVPASQVEWVVTGYLAGFTASLLPGGRLADRIGVRHAFLLSILASAVAYGAGAMAPGLGLLIASRVLAGIGSGLGVPAGLALVNHMAQDEASRARNMAVYTACGVAGFTGGFFLGGLLAGISWRVDLAFPALLATAIGIGAYLVLPAVPRSRMRAGRAVGALLRAWQVRYAAVGVAAVFACYVTYQFMVTVQLAYLGWTPFETSGLFGALGLVVAVGTLFTGRLIERHGPDFILMVGCFSYLTGYIVTTALIWLDGDPGFWALLPEVAMLGVGFATAFPVLMTVGMSAAGEREGATTGGIIMTAQHLASFLALPLITWAVDAMGRGGGGPLVALFLVVALAGVGALIAVGAVVRRPGLVTWA